MERERYLGYLAADQARLRSLAARDLISAVPTCPGWTMADLVRHVAGVYLHKVECMRRGEFPQSWPPAGIDDEEPVALLDRAYAELRDEFDTRSPSDPTPTFFGPDQTVAFWIRRRAQESVVHRVDAELAVGGPVGPIPDALAVDGVDEVLRVFLAYSSREWPEHFAEALAGSDGRTVRVDAGERSWLVRLDPAVVRVDDAFGGTDALGGADATVTGRPSDVLLWLWRRTGDTTIMAGGDPAVVSRLRQVLREGTQ
jgi:uncharacterized protein (TIGR03083 family)